MDGITTAERIAFSSHHFDFGDLDTERVAPPTEWDTTSLKTTDSADTLVLCMGKVPIMVADALETSVDGQERVPLGEIKASAHTLDRLATITATATAVQLGSVVFCTVSGDVLDRDAKEFRSKVLSINPFKRIAVLSEVAVQYFLTDEYTDEAPIVRSVLTSPDISLPIPTLPTPNVVRGVSAAFLLHGHVAEVKVAAIMSYRENAGTDAELADSYVTSLSTPLVAFLGEGWSANKATITSLVKASNSQPRDTMLYL
eukprot:m.357974 g.357974  ORF g.357974 m.357974 type:complete len:257 (+) comp18001_c0_seq1:177-947(+)